MNYPIIDVSSWEEDIYEYGHGEREKKWLIDPTTKKLAMLKFPREGRGEHWAEKLCSEFAKILEFPCADVELAILNGRFACLSYFFVNKNEGYSHYDGGKYFPPDYDADRNLGYNFQLIESILQEFNLVKEFLYIVVFDALVGNGDRHQDNWGITRHEKRNDMTISPLYDNSASLCREKGASDAATLIESKEELLRFIYRSKSKIGWLQTRQEKHFVLIRKLYRLFPIEMNALINKVRKLSSEIIRHTVERLPEQVITNIQKELVIQYVSCRRDILLKIGDKMKNNISELLMVWKDPDTRQRFVVGELQERDGIFTFQYVNPELDEAIKHGFKNYPSFPDLKATYSQEGLFRSVAGRLPQPKRPDYATILDRYGLDSSSSEMEILEATRGRIPTDTFEFVRKIIFKPGDQFTIDFELAGARHYDLEKAAKNLDIGVGLNLLRDNKNIFDQFAVRVETKENLTIGYVPKYFSKPISEMLDSHIGSYEAKIIGIDLQNESPDEWVKIRVAVTAL